MGLPADILITIIGLLFAGLMFSLGYIFRSILKKLDTICASKVDKENCKIFGRQNHDDHDEMWDRVNHHTHDRETGKVQVS